MSGRRTDDPPSARGRSITPPMAPGLSEVRPFGDRSATPNGFISKAERPQRQEARQAKERKAAEDRRRQQEQEGREKAEREAIEADWASLTPPPPPPPPPEELETASIAPADAETGAMEDGPLKRMGQMIRRHASIRHRLARGERVAAGS